MGVGWMGWMEGMGWTEQDGWTAFFVPGMHMVSILDRSFVDEFGVDLGEVGAHNHVQILQQHAILPKRANGVGSKWGRHQIQYLIQYLRPCGHTA